MNSPTTSLNDFFAETFSQDFLDEAAIEYSLAEIAARAYAAKQHSRLSIRDIARKMGSKGPAVVQRIVDQASPHNVTVSTLVRFAHACGFELRVDFAPKERFANWHESTQRVHTLSGWRVDKGGDRGAAEPRRNGAQEPALALAA